MPDILAKKPLFLQMATLLGVAAGGMLVARYVNARQINGAEKLTEALLNAERLREAKAAVSNNAAQALAECAAFFVQVNHLASEGVGIAGRTEDPDGHQRDSRHPFTKDHAMTVSKKRDGAPTQTYRLTVHEVGSAIGSRTLGAERLSGTIPSRTLTETAEVVIDDYEAQFEAELQIADYLIFGKAKISGTIAMRDSAGNVGRLRIAEDGKVTGTITNNAKIMGRFDGQADSGVYYKVNQLEGDSGSNA